MRYDKVNTDLNFVDREHEVNEFWKKNDIFGKSLKPVRALHTTHSMTDRRRRTASRTSVMS